MVLCGDLPTRVRDVEGVTASLFYGFQNAPSVWEVGACNLPLYTTNNYYRAERAFRSVAGWNNTNGFVAFHLLGTNLANAKLVADRGVAAHSTFPAGTIYLYNLATAREVGGNNCLAMRSFLTALPFAGGMFHRARVR